ncbi:hypothetical protein N2152v2_004236 [Parachlorella kessleri]
MNGFAASTPFSPAAPPSLLERVAKAVTDFNAQFNSPHAGALSQVWLPEVAEDGGIVLGTQGLPYSISGTGDLLALFRCISCKYKFSTDLTKPQLMGAVGRVFTSGEPEMSHNVQQYDRAVFLRAAEAQRCRVAAAVFMPLYAAAKRDCVLGVFEVAFTEGDVLFPAVVDWLRCCLREADLYTADVDKHMYAGGLRQMPPEYNVSAFESGTAAVLQHRQQQAAAADVAAGQRRASEGGGGNGGRPGSMALPPSLPYQSAGAVQQQQRPRSALTAEVDQAASPAVRAGGVPAAAEKEQQEAQPAGRAERVALAPSPAARPSRSDPSSARTTTASGGQQAQQQQGPRPQAALTRVAPAQQMQRAEQPAPGLGVASSGHCPAASPVASEQQQAAGQGEEEAAPALGWEGQQAATARKRKGSPSGAAAAAPDGLPPRQRPWQGSEEQQRQQLGQHLDGPAEQQQQQVQQQHRQRQGDCGSVEAAEPAVACACAADSGGDMRDEDGEVVQPAKPLPPLLHLGSDPLRPPSRQHQQQRRPPPGSGSNGLVESSGAPGSGTADGPASIHAHHSPGAHEGALPGAAGGAFEGSGRSSNTDNKPTLGGSSNPSSRPPSGPSSNPSSRRVSNPSSNPSSQPSRPSQQPPEKARAQGASQETLAKQPPSAAVQLQRPADGLHPSHEGGHGEPRAWQLQLGGTSGSGPITRPGSAPAVGGASSAVWADVRKRPSAGGLEAFGSGLQLAALGGVGGGGSGSGMPSPVTRQAGALPSQVGSARAVSLSPPLAATLAAMLAPLQAQQQAAGSAALAPLAAGSSRLPPMQQQEAAAGAALLAPAVATAAALRSQQGLPNQAGPGMSSVLPGGTLTVVQQPGAGALHMMPQQLQGGAGAAADMSRLGSAGAGLAEMARIGSGGVGQKNLTLEDLQPHFGYGLKEAASRLGICPTTLKRTCRRLGISRWPRRQLVRLTKQHMAAAKVQMDPHQQQPDGARPQSASDGSGGGEPPPQLPLRPAAAGALAAPAAASPALLLALQQAQHQGAGGVQGTQDGREAGASPGGPSGRTSVPLGPLVTSPSLHQQLLQLQQQQGQVPSPALGHQPPFGGQQQHQPQPQQERQPGASVALQLTPTQLQVLQQQLVAAVAAAAAAAGPAQPQPPPLQSCRPPPPHLAPQAGAPPGRLGGEDGQPEAAPRQQVGFLGQGSLPAVPAVAPPNGAVRLDPLTSGSLHAGLQWEPPPLRLGGAPAPPARLGDGAAAPPPWQQQQAAEEQRGQLGPGFNKQEEGTSGGGAGSLYPHFAPPGSSSGGVAQQDFPRGHEPPMGPAFSGLGGSPWQLPARDGSGAAPSTGDASQYAELAAAAAAANLQHQLAGFSSGRRHLAGHGGPRLPNRFSLSGLPHTGDHLGVHSVGSLDILAGAELDSVANSPRGGISHLGGLSNLGLSNFGLSNLELPGGAGGPEFSVGQPPGLTTTSQQRP